MDHITRDKTFDAEPKASECARRWADAGLEAVSVSHAGRTSSQGYVSKGDDLKMLVRAVREVAAGDNFISPQLAEAVAFSGHTIKAIPFANE